MSVFVQPVIAKKPRSRRSLVAAYTYAAILLCMVLCQLFTFDDFIGLIGGYALPGEVTSVYLLSCTIVVSEVFAIPFLLRMLLSPLMRIFSMFLGWLVPAIWVLLTLWSALGGGNVSNVGMFGDILHLPPGIWWVVVSLLLVILSAWSSWGLWPGKRK